LLSTSVHQILSCKMTHKEREKVSSCHHNFSLKQIHLPQFSGQLYCQPAHCKRDGWDRCRCHIDILMDCTYIEALIHQSLSLESGCEISCLWDLSREAIFCFFLADAHLCFSSLSDAISLASCTYQPDTPSFFFFFLLIIILHRDCIYYMYHALQEVIRGRRGI
jgi:hypothetical protein